MKQFSNYQYIGGEMNERDKQEVGSKFWNEGKWNNFVLPLLSKDCKEKILIDMGYNAGVFLKEAEKLGFDRVIGVDSNSEAIEKAKKYKKEHNSKFEVIRRDMRTCIVDLPVADYTVLAMAHYYFYVNNWLDYMDKLWSKSEYVIIVTASKRPNPCRAASDSDGIRRYFKNWIELEGIPELPLENDPFPRRQWTLFFKNPVLERMNINELDIPNNLQNNFYAELDKGIDPFNTGYYKNIQRKRTKWSDRRKRKLITDKVKLYENIKKNGLLRPIIIDSTNRVVDGNHRVQMLKELGYTTVLVRKA